MLWNNWMKEKLQLLLIQEISKWENDDIYAISLYVNDEEDDPLRPTVTLGYNTERQVRESMQDASDEQEARWNYAFWLQNAELCWGVGESAGDVKSWLSEQNLTDREDEVTEAFVKLLVDIVRDIHTMGLLRDKFGKEIPILIHELEYYEEIAEQNISANGEELVRAFVSFCIQG